MKKYNSKEKQGVLLVLPCHCVYDKESDSVYAEYPEDRGVYEGHIRDAVKRAESLKKSGEYFFLIVSGGPTKKETEMSEALSYFDFSERLGVNLPDHSCAEEYALTSVENLLLSIYRYRMVTGCFPYKIETVSWDFKEKRYKAALSAINRWPMLETKWESLEYISSGKISGEVREKGLAAEREYVKALSDGLDSYYSLDRTKTTLKKRDLHNSRRSVAEFYKGFPLPFKQMNPA